MGVEWIITLPPDFRLYITSQRSPRDDTQINFIETQSRGSFIITELDRLEERSEMQFIKLRRKAGAPILSISDYPTPGSVPTTVLLNAVSICESGRRI